MTEPVPIRPPQGVPYERLYARVDDDPRSVALINGREPRPHPNCRVCTIVPYLVEEQNYSLQQAAWVEYDIVKMYYNMWPSRRISDYLFDSYEVEISHDSLNNHKQRHIPSVELQYLQNIKEIASSAIDEGMMQSIGELLILTVEKTKEMLASGAIKPTAAAGMDAAKTILTVDFEIQREKEQARFLQAFELALGEHVPREKHREIIESMRTRYRELQPTDVGR